MVSMMAHQQKKILIVEDDAMTSEVIYDCLLEAGFLVRSTQDANEALDIVNTWSPHLVVTDHDMPNMSGMDFLCALRALENYVTVIFVSGRKDIKTKVRALQEGADDYIEKPFRIEELVARVSVCLRNNDIHRELKAKNDTLAEMVEMDDLTGLFNMRSIYQKIDLEIARAERSNSSIAVIMMDMDRFKSVNDTNDHLFGSFVLSEVGKIIKDNIREYDFAARYGGDEFLICLHNIDKLNAKEFCERLRKQISTYDFTNEQSSMELTCSIGVCVMVPASGIDARDFVREADHALYQAKKTGRNKSVLFEFNSKNSKKVS